MEIPVNNRAAKSKLKLIEGSMATSTQPQVTPERIMQFVWGYAPPLILEAAIRHRVFDVLDGGAKTVEEVKEATGASARGLTAVMNALVGLNFLTKDRQARYALTPESSAFLVTSKPSFQGGLIRHCSELIPKWLRLNEIVAPGGTIAVAELLVNDERTEPLAGLLFAVNMLVNTDNGDTYSFREISAWLAEAGFVNPRMLDSPGPSPLILATKP
jgi:hypothetical protein